MLNLTPKKNLVLMLALAFALPLATMYLAQAAGAVRNTAPARPQGPCDIYAAGGTPCVAAHSTTRALSAAYQGPLYQVMRQSDGKTLDIGVVQPGTMAVVDGGGYSDAAAQDAFCAKTTCVITRIYDQSGKGNHLYQAPPGRFVGPAKGGFDTLPIADMAPITISGHRAYGAFIMPGMGLRNNDTTGIAMDDEPEGIYYVIDGTHYDSGCCFDYGNASTNSKAVGTGTMETAYYGTASTWGTGSGPGPWIMSDMEAGLFSGYNAKQNVGSPTIDAWRFVTAVVDGGGGNQWDLRGGNAQEGKLTTFYSGVRPGSPGNNAYFPMHKKGGVLLGDGGDNGNGSSGTFYEGVMTAGYPTAATTDAVQANIVAAQYNVAQVGLARVARFAPGSSQNINLTFTNTTREPATGVKLSLAPPQGWTVAAAGTNAAFTTSANPVPPGATVNASFKITSSSAIGNGVLTGKAEWMSATSPGTQTATTTAMVRNAPSIKINEVQLGGGANATSQFIELYNAGDSEIELSHWSLSNIQSQWAPVQLATIPPGTKLPAHGFYLLAAASSGLAAPSEAGDATIQVRSTTDFAVDQPIEIEGEARKIAKIGTPAAVITTLFVPVSTGPWLTFPAGSTNLPVTSAAGFEVGQKIGIDLGGHFELTTITAVGKASTQTTLAVASVVGVTTIKIASNANLTVGDKLTVDTGVRKELATVKSVGVATTGNGGGRGRGGAGGGGAEIELESPLKFAHPTGIDVAGPGTGITFAPATKFPHVSGDAVQALGSGITLDQPLTKTHPYGAAVVNPQVTTTGYQGAPAPNQWFGGSLATQAGALALLDSSGEVVVDAMVYGSQQSSSSANGTITSPELAALAGDQGKGGHIVVVPAAGRGGRGRGGAGAAPAARTLGRMPDGADSENLATDFQLLPPTPGAPNGKSP